MIKKQEETLKREIIKEIKKSLEKNKDLKNKLKKTKWEKLHIYDLMKVNLLIK